MDVVVVDAACTPLPTKWSGVVVRSCNGRIVLVDRKRGLMYFMLRNS